MRIFLAGSRSFGAAVLAQLLRDGHDVARGGTDEDVIARRHGMWFDEPIASPGAMTPDGAASGARVVAALRDGAVVHVDAFGVGALAYGFLMGIGLQVIGVMFGDKVPDATDQTGRIRFFNLRSYLWWRMRELLDPLNNTGIALPPHQRLRADLCAPKFTLAGQLLKVQSREDIVKRLGRSPDRADALCLAIYEPAAELSMFDVAARGRSLFGR